MSSLDALARLRRLGVPVIETADAAAALRQSPSAASRTLARLAKAELVAPVRHGVWSLEPNPNPYHLVEHLTAPLPSYLSLQTALHLRGLIEQIPAIIYVVSLARTQRVQTTAGTFSIHHVAPAIFVGFERSADGLPLATAEKALFDLAYLSGGRSRSFAAVPELELPRGFRWNELASFTDRITSARHRALVKRRLRQFVASERRGPIPRWLR